MTTHFKYLPDEVQHELRCIANTLITPGKGILTADESASTIGKRFQELGLQNDENTRRQWRLILFSCDQKVSDYISGTVLTDETFQQTDDKGKLLIDYLNERCIIPGIKVDYGLVILPGSESEVITQGMDNLGSRLVEYRKRGCAFARWRCVFKLGTNTPSYRALKSNADILARFASICQSQRICPLIEPEVSPEGNHDIEYCQKVMETVMSFVFRALNEHHVFLEGVVLKSNMVMAGMSSNSNNTPEYVAKATLTALQRTVPPAVPGICFSSDGQTEEEATNNLHAISVQGGVKPWRLSFAYGRALQASAMRIWRGDSRNKVAAQEEFLKRASINSYATIPAYEYNPPYENALRRDDTIEYEGLQGTITPYSMAETSGSVDESRDEIPNTKMMPDVKLVEPPNVFIESPPNSKITDPGQKKVTESPFYAEESRKQTEQRRTGFDERPHKFPEPQPYVEPSDPAQKLAQPSVPAQKIVQPPRVKSFPEPQPYVESSDPAQKSAQPSVPAQKIVQPPRVKSSYPTQKFVKPPHMEFSDQSEKFVDPQDKFTEPQADFTQPSQPVSVTTDFPSGSTIETQGQEKTNFMDKKLPSGAPRIIAPTYSSDPNMDILHNAVNDHSDDLTKKS